MELYPEELQAHRLADERISTQTPLLAFLSRQVYTSNDRRP